MVNLSSFRLTHYIVSAGVSTAISHEDTAASDTYDIGKPSIGSLGATEPRIQLLFCWQRCPNKSEISLSTGWPSVV